MSETNATPDLLAELQRLQAENEALRTANKRKAPPVTPKVSAKGAVSVYGLNVRFPVTLYADQWIKLFGEAEKIKAFIAENKANLATKE